ncbi:MULTISPECIES: hypothetical protein [Limnospira]|uniref:Uncharacterized protein n=1 Tax=Limnospira fusiformis PMC 851.14 TaxID=2219512 RepID=A0ABU9EUK1_LIMFS|nr:MULTISPECIES: hypothetical protein [unclassified Limnospira]MDT9190690.1 hypothetical protein [Limnospira sp. PMC 894.15]MDT9201187.1 hypothetical protein [Limnospira sp. PMC 1042.18]MDT9236434.1 hypothetical protein [Limnospira sp. PMC 917.15]
MTIGFDFIYRVDWCDRLTNLMAIAYIYQLPRSQYPAFYLSRSNSGRRK